MMATAPIAIPAIAPALNVEDELVVVLDPPAAEGELEDPDDEFEDPEDWLKVVC